MIFNKYFLAGKAASYLTNAYDDAKIADHLKNYLKDKRLPLNETGQRAQNLIDQTPPEDSQQRILIQAFTQYWLNGHTDFQYSRFFLRLIGQKEHLPATNPYHPLETKKINLFQPWLKISLGKLELLYQYAEQNEINLKLKKREVRREIQRVQKANSRYNHQVSLALRENNDIFSAKTKKLLKLAKKAKKPDQFLIGAIKGQVGATIWDKLYSILLKLGLR